MHLYDICYINDKALKHVASTHKQNVIQRNISYSVKTVQQYVDITVLQHQLTHCN